MPSAAEAARSMKAVADGLPSAVPDILKPERYSATALQAAERCLLAARFDREQDTAGPAAMVGRVAHDIMAACAWKAHATGESFVTIADADRIARHVMNNPAEAGPLSLAQQGTILQMIEGWAGAAVFDHEGADYFGVEVPVRHNLGAATLSGRIDQLTIRGATADVDDWKTGWKVPTQAQMEARDDTGVPELLQLPIYAWHVHEDHPEVEYFNLRLHFLRSGAIRTAFLTLDDVLNVELYLATVIQRLDKAWASGEFPATPGTWCSFCAKPNECPIPEGHRPHSISRQEDAQAQLDALVVEQARIEQRKDVLQAWLEQRDIDTVLESGDMRAALTATKAQKRVDYRAMERDGIDVEVYRKTTGGGSYRLEIARATTQED